MRIGKLGLTGTFFFAFSAILLLAVYSDAGFQKVKLFGGQIGWIDVCAGNSSVLYAGTSHGGLWLSRDTGATWSETRFWNASNSGASMFAISPQDPGTVLAFAEQNGRVLRSTDFGTNWTEIGGFYSAIRPVRMTVDSRSGLLFLAGFRTAVNEGIILSSKDFGQTWDTTKFVSNGRAVADMAITGTGTIAVACPDVKASTFPKIGDTATGRIWLSRDSGATWTEAAGITVAPWKLSAGGSTIAAVCIGKGFGSGRIEVSRGDGSSFATIADSSSIGLNQSSTVAVSQSGDTIFLFGIQGSDTGAYRLRRSIWNGSAWSGFSAISGGFLSGDTMINASRILIDPSDPARMYIADGFEQGCLRSRDRGLTWEVKNEGINAVLIYDGTKTPKGSLLALGSGSVFRSDDNADSWRRIYRSTSGGAFGAFDAGVIAAHPDSSLPYIFAVDKDGLLASFDDGLTWKLVLDVPQGWSGSRDIVFLPSNPAVGYAAFGNTSATPGDSGAYLYRTSDTGHTWQATSYKGASIQALAVCPWDATKLWAGVGEIAFWRMKSGAPGGILEISDATPPVLTGRGLTGKIPYRIAFDKEQPGMVYASAVSDTNNTTGPLFVSKDSGATWDTLTPIRAFDETNKILDMVYSEGNLFFTTFGGIFRYVRSGSTYERLAVATEVGNASCLIAGSLYAGTSTGLWKFNGQLTAGKPRRALTINRTSAPDLCRRHITVAMPKTGGLEMYVSSMNGRTVRSAKKWCAAGSHRLVWDDGTLAPGVYFVKIRMPGISTTSIAVSGR